jgi:hypothetical protein
MKCDSVLSVLIPIIAKLWDVFLCENSAISLLDFFAKTRKQQWITQGLCCKKVIH